MEDFSIQLRRLNANFNVKLTTEQTLINALPSCWCRIVITFIEDLIALLVYYMCALFNCVVKRLNI